MTLDDLKSYLRTRQFFSVHVSRCMPYECGTSELSALLPNLGQCTLAITTPEYEETNKIFGLFGHFFVICSFLEYFEHLENSYIFGVLTGEKVGG